MKDLPDVTLVAYDGPQIERTVKVLNHCSTLFNFGAIKLWTDQPEKTIGLTSKAEIVKIPVATWETHVNWLIKEIEFPTSHFLLVAWDGYIINPDKWDDSWLQYDFIGSPWSKDMFRTKLIVGSNQVGCEGFSLQSKKMIDMCKLAAEHFWPKPFHTDAWKCQLFYEVFRYMGIKYAPLEVASRFGFEMPIEEGWCTLKNAFGFHKWQGNQNDPIFKLNEL